MKGGSAGGSLLAYPSASVLYSKLLKRLVIRAFTRFFWASFCRDFLKASTRAADAGST